MDSLSQIVLGAAVGELCLGRKIGNKAQLIGAIAGTIPDLDVISSFFIHDEIVKLTIHRAYSHSMFTHIVLALPFTWLTWRIFKKKISFREWYILWFLGFFTHAILDSFTTYGTQLFLPFTHYLVGFDNISVLDPFWTIPFMIFLIVAMFCKRESTRRRKWALAGVMWGCLYMAYTFVNKYVVHQHFVAELERQHIPFDNLDTSPSILNNWLWSGIAITPDTLWIGEYSVLQDSEEVEWTPYPVHSELLNHHPAQKEIAVLKWFSQGKYLVTESDSNLNFYVAKWGRMAYEEKDIDKSFVFHYQLYSENGTWRYRVIQPKFGPGDFDKAWNQLWHRVRFAK